MSFHSGPHYTGRLSDMCCDRVLVCAEEDRWLERPPLRATVRVLNMSFFRKIITRHDTGLGEAYMDEDYEVAPSAFAECFHSQSLL